MADSPSPIQFDGLGDALLGVGYQYTKPELLDYSARKIVDILIKRDNMSEEEAWEFFEFNIACLWAGEGTPIIVYEVEVDA